MLCRVNSFIYITGCMCTAVVQQEENGNYANDEKASVSDNELSESKESELPEYDADDGSEDSEQSDSDDDVSMAVSVVSDTTLTH